MSLYIYIKTYDVTKSKLDISQIVKTKDDKTYTFKYIILTREKVSKGVLTSLGKNARELVISEIVRQIHRVHKTQCCCTACKYMSYIHMF